MSPSSPQFREMQHDRDMARSREDGEAEGEARGMRAGLFGTLL